jgi:mitochondrial fission protein ELM1
MIMENQRQGTHAQLLALGEYILSCKIENRKLKRAFG